MGIHFHFLTQNRIKRLFINGLPPEQHNRLLKTASTCRECGLVYRRFQELENALTNDVVVSHFARSRVKAAIVQHFVHKQSEPVHPTKPLLRWATAGAAIVCGILLTLLLLPADELEHRTPIPPAASLGPAPILTAKGSQHHDITDIGIRVFQVNRAGTKIDEPPSLSTGDILTFTYTYAKPLPGYLALFGIQAEGDIRWYYPDYDGKRSIEIKGDKIDEPLEDGIDLSVNHTPGWLRITALFSTNPIEVDAIEKTVSQAKDRKTLKELTPFHITDEKGRMLQYSVIVKLEDRK